MSGARLNRLGNNAPGNSGEPPSVPSVRILLPPVAPSLVEHLEKAFPDSLRLVEQMKSFDAALGARAVVNHIKQLLDEQNK